VKKRKVRLPRIAAALLILGILFGSTTGGRAAGQKLSASYIYFGSKTSYTGIVDAAQGSLEQVSPNYFNLSANGGLVLTSAVSQSFVDAMHQRGIKVVPFLSNHWDRQLGIAALSNRQALAQQLAQAVVAYNLDGVDVDLENLTPAERAAYVDFVRLLRLALPEDKIVSVAVAANPYGTNAGWQGSYDYAELARYSDYLEIMAYDEHYQGGPAGPVASYGFVEKSIRYALQKVPAQQIMLSLPFYGRIWRDGGGSPQGYGVSNTRVDELVRTYHGSVYYDSARQASYAKISIAENDPKPILGGNALSAGNYTLWYENERTMKNLLTLVQKYDILGATSWSLGQESENTWDYYTLWLNGCYFGDIQTHWAKDSVFAAYRSGWVRGTSATAFSPDTALTRAQAAVMLVRMLGLNTNNKAGQSFSDTQGHWAQAEIEAARQNGIISGVGDNRFAPDRRVTREEMAVMLYNLLSSGQNGAGGGLSAAGYTDVTEQGNPWSYEAITALSRTDLLRGYADGSFRPKNNLSRAEMAVLLIRLSQ